MTSTIDLVGEPFAVIESDPGLFSTFIRSIGVRGYQVNELYSIEPWATDHLRPQGLIFCFLWRKDTHRPADFNDPDAERVWFANQLNDDSCASLALLNVLFNTHDIALGQKLQDFRADTEQMSSVMKGLAISNCSFLRESQNMLARPADVRGSVNAITTTTLEEAKKQTKQPPIKRRKTTSSPSKNTKATVEDVDPPETYHFIGYVPYAGKVWELDGLKSGPLEVGEIPLDQNRDWMEVARPALRMKMQKYGAGDGENIRFNLLAIVPDPYPNLSDQLELLKREKMSLERRLLQEYPDGWESKVDPTLHASADQAFITASSTAALGPTYAQDFGSLKMEQDLAILEMPARNLIFAWETCIKIALTAKLMVEDELVKPITAHTDNMKRVFDYEPFILEFIECSHREGVLETILCTKKQRAGKPEV